MNAGNEDALDLPMEAPAFDYEAVFHEQYGRVTRVIARVVQDPARAEELAVEVFWKLWRQPSAQGPKASGWLYRVAVRSALDELRKQSRREKYERLFGFPRRTATPEELQAASEDRRQVRVVLAALPFREAALLLLRADGLSYQEMADALALNPASVGTMLTRAQKAFRKEYIKRYGRHDGYGHNKLGG